MKRFLYFLLSGVAISWLFGGVLLLSGDYFYNSGCLECGGLFNMSCTITESTLRCHTLGTLEETAKFTQYVYDNEVGSKLILAAVYTVLGLLIGLIGWASIVLINFIKQKITHQDQLQ